MSVASFYESEDKKTILGYVQQKDKEKISGSKELGNSYYHVANRLLMENAKENY